MLHFWGQLLTFLFLNGIFMKPSSTTIEAADVNGLGSLPADTLVPSPCPQGNDCVCSGCKAVDLNLESVMFTFRPKDKALHGQKIIISPCSHSLAEFMHGSNENIKLLFFLHSPPSDDLQQWYQSLRFILSQDK